MRRINALIAAAIVASTASAGASGTGEMPDALVADAMNAPAHVSYAGTVEITKVGARGVDVTVFDVEHRAPNRTRRTFSAPSDVGGDAVIVMGGQSYAVDVKRGRIVESDETTMNDPTAIAANYLLLRHNYHAVANPDDVFAGRQTMVVALVSDYTNRPVVVVRIDRTTKLVLDKQRFAADGTMVDEMRFVRVSFPSQIPERDFTLPTDLQLVQGARRNVPSAAIDGLVARAGFAARAPKNLPYGFASVEGSLEKIEGVRTLHVLYSDGVRAVSLFQNSDAPTADLSRYNVQQTSVAGHDARFGQAGPTTILAWSNGGVNYTLVGDLDLTDLQKLAASI